MGAERSSTCIVVIVILTITVLSQNRVIGFRMKLIPIDSPESPLSTATSHRLELLANISLTRSLRYRKPAPPHSMIHLQTPVIGGLTFSSYFITPLSLGTGAGAFTAYAILDTGSSEFWIQSQGCENCINVKGGSFNPSASPTYREVSLNDDLCRPMLQWRDGACMYSVVYGGAGQSTVGAVGTDFLFFEDAEGKSGEFFSVAFGLGLDNRNFEFAVDRDGENVISGVLGLAIEEPRSFMYQLRESTKYKFSYCLPSPAEDSKAEKATAMYFGEEAWAIGPEWQTMPMLSDGNSYHLYLEGISVNGSLLPIDSDVFRYDYQRQTAFYIDIGSPFTLLETSVYEALTCSMTRYFTNIGISVSRESHSPYNQCYTSNPRPGQKYPEVKLHFKGGSELFVWPDTLFTPFLDGCCVAVLPTNGPSLLGAWQQANYQSLYNVKDGVIAFAPRDCLGIK